MNYRLIGAMMLLLTASTFAATFNVTRSGGFADSGFQIMDLVQTPDRAFPGDEVQMKFTLKLTGANPAASSVLNILAPFFVERKDYVLGDLLPGDEKPITVDFTIPNETKAGSYYVFAYVSTRSAGQSQIGEIPLTINEPTLSNALVATVQSASDLYAGSAVDVPVRIFNVGSLTATDVVVQMQLGTNSPLTPVGSDRQYTASIAPNSSADVVFTIGASSGTAPGFYPMNLVISYKVDKALQPSITQNVGIMTQAKTGLRLTSDTSSVNGQMTVTVTIANTGDTAVRAVYVSATSQDYIIVGSPDKFIGTLNLDDSSTVTLTVVPRGNSTRPLNVKLSYKDDLNVEHVQNEQVPVRGNGGGTGQASGFANQQFGRRNQGFNVFGLQPLEIGVIIVALIGAFFAYKWYKRRKK